MSFMKYLIIILVLITTVTSIFYFTSAEMVTETEVVKNKDEILIMNENTVEEEVLHPLSIEFLRSGTYPGSELIIEEELNPGVKIHKINKWVERR